MARAKKAKPGVLAVPEVENSAFDPRVLAALETISFPETAFDHRSCGAGGGDEEGFVHPDVLATQTPEFRAEYAFEKQRRLEVEGVQVERVAFDSRKLVTIESDDATWSEDPPLGRATRLLEVSEGAIVRLRPGAHVTDEHLERVRAWCLARKPASIVVVPRPRAAVVPNDAIKVVAKHVGARAAVEQLVEESNAGDRDALRELTSKVMDEEGL